jgi:tetraacyldisaccharide 4'-kinase
MNPPGSLIMMPLRVVYSAITRARLAAYRSGLFSVSTLPAPVISVGNLTTGGTGKTPLVEWVCRALVNHIKTDVKVCVLTRGYKRANPQEQVLVSDGTNILTDERQAGDEPFLLAKNLLGVAAVIANADRVAAGQWSIASLGAQAFVLDDGFQHLRLARDFDIVAIDATNPWGDGGLLPHGRLREEVTGLSRADCIVITRSEQVQSLNYLQDSIRKLSLAPIFTSRMVTSALRTIQGDTLGKNVLGGASVGAFCAIGNPASFFNHLQREDCRLSFTQAFPDHHVYKQAEINTVVDRAKAAGATALVTTAKDAVKLGAINIDLPCYKLEIEISVDQNEKLIELIRNSVASKLGLDRR